MLEVSNISVVGWEPAIRGMRNPMNSWERSDSVFTDGVVLGDALGCTISNLNWYREKYLSTNEKDQWYNMIQLLPTNYNQRRTVMMNYEVASTIIRQRTGHKLDEWKVLVDALKDLPYLMDIMS